MTDYDASSLPRPNTPKRSLARSSIPRSTSSYGSYDTGESSTLASFHDTTIDAVTDASASPQRPKDVGSDLQTAEQGEFGEQLDQDNKYDTQRRRYSKKPRPSSAFLLSNTFLSESSKPLPKRPGDDRWKSRIPIDKRRSRSPLESFGDSNSLESSDSFPALEGQNRAGAQSAQIFNGRGDVGDDRSRSQAAHRRATMIASLRPNSAPFDIDSNQIVSMALDLSESRRLASRRNITSPIAPHLTQISENNPARNLSLHLQQQRRSLRNISPRADAKLVSRIPTPPRMNNPLQPAYDDGATPYRFTSSTLHRAQKAKEYLELMAQYRRVLLFLDPLKQDGRSRPSTSSASPDSPRHALSGPQGRMGRAYNPLQYIRNRKIRARERKIIDGEAQGFGDVPRVTDWIDEVAAHTASSPTAESRLPSFPAADECMKQQLLTSNLPRPMNKSKRPRFEWSFDPADMLADIYWLEQNDNKYLIEDRHYNKIFTFKPAPPQSTIQATEHLKPGLISSTPKELHDSDGLGISDSGIAHSIKTDVETTLANTRDRARQKLQDLRGMHHKHSSSAHVHHDFLRFRRGSTSSSSDNESDRRRRGRSGTLSASGKDLLEKQMNEMLAKETEEELNQLPQEDIEVRDLKPQPFAMVTPLKSSEAFSRQHSRRNSRSDAVDYLDKPASAKPSQSPSIPSARASLDIPARLSRSSFEIDPSRPAIPEVTPKLNRQSCMPAIGMDLSPHPSRPSSPARNPFLKVKNMFRDHDDRESEDKVSSPIEPVGPLGISAATKDIIQTTERSRSKSSSREIVMKTHENTKVHRSIGSLSHRPDDQVGLRNIFKGGAKLDDMIRGGVSKVTDLIWKKDSDSSSESGDDSDGDDSRGRRREAALSNLEGSARQHQKQRSVKNYLDIMPNFKSTTDSTDKSYHEVEGKLQRVEELKPGSDNARNIMDSEMSENDANYPIVLPKRSSKEFPIDRTDLPVAYAGDKSRAFDEQNWGVSDPSLSHNGPLSRREVARLRTLILCSGIKALEMSRRATESQPLLKFDDKVLGFPATELTRFAPKEVANICVPQTQLFPTAARILTDDINRSIRMIEASATIFATETAPALRNRVDTVHTRIAMEFMDLTRRAADEVEEVSSDIVDSQRLKIKSVVDVMDKMLRRRRRRFRYVRRAGWLAVEWVLVGFMWYVWFIVMIARIFLGAGRGAVSVVRWLLWL